MNDSVLKPLLGAAVVGAALLGVLLRYVRVRRRQHAARARDLTASQEMPFAALDVILLAARPGETVRLERMFVAPTRIAPREHEWYYGTECTHCHRASAALRDPDEGQKTLRFSGAGGIRFNCHHCNGLLKVVPDRIVLFKFEG